MIFNIKFKDKPIICGDFKYSLKRDREGFNKFELIGVDYNSDYDNYLSSITGDFDIIITDFVNDWGVNSKIEKIILKDAFFTDKYVRLRDNVVDFYGEFEIYDEE